MGIVISGNGLDMGNNPVSNASQVDSTLINENGSNVISQGKLAYDADTSSYIPNTLASGAIIERGSNANGEYIKFADGTLICKHSVVLASMTTAYGTGLYCSPIDLVWVYPHSFIYYPNNFGTVNNSGCGIVNVDDSVSSQLKYRGLTYGNGIVGKAKLTAIGRWK